MSNEKAATTRRRTDSMAEPTHDEHLTQIRDRSRRLAAIPLETSADNRVMRDMIDSIGDVRWLLEQLEQLRDELAEARASHNPLLRCILVKAAPDRDLYIGWSNNVEGPTGIWTRAEAIAYGFPRSRLDRADRNGTSSMVPGSGQWDDHGFIAEQRGWLRRDRIADYALALHADNQDAAFDLLEPFEGETEVRRG